MYPVMLNIKGRKCIVIGGGDVALRKAEKLCQCGGDVTVISREFKDGFESLDTIKKEYEKSDIEGAFLVTAATDDKALNRHITTDARGMGIISYAVDDAECSDFILSASHTDGDITVSVSTNGKYPFLAKRIRDEAAEDIAFYASILPILEKYRKQIIEEFPERKKELLKLLVSDAMIETAKKDTVEFDRKIKQHIDKFRGK